jgi:hypothetical protein
MLGEDVLAKVLPGIAVELKHGGVELKTSLVPISARVVV